MFGRFSLQFSRVAGGSIGILSEPKVILTESDLILLCRYSGEGVLSSEFWVLSWKTRRERC